MTRWDNRGEITSIRLHWVNNQGSTWQRLWHSWVLRSRSGGDNRLLQLLWFSICIALLGISLFFWPLFVNFWVIRCIVRAQRGLVGRGDRGKRGRGFTSPALGCSPSCPCPAGVAAGAGCCSLGHAAVSTLSAWGGIASSGLRPSRERVVLGVCPGTVAPATGWPGGSRTAAFPLERWQSRHFFITFLSSVLSYTLSMLY